MLSPAGFPTRRLSLTPRAVRDDGGYSWSDSHRAVNLFLRTSAQTRIIGVGRRSRIAPALRTLAEGDAMARKRRPNDCLNRLAPASGQSDESNLIRDVVSRSH